MSPEGLSGLGPTVQLIVMGLAAVFIAGGIAINYFKSAKKEAAGTGVVLTGDAAELKKLVDALERLTEGIERVERALPFSYEAMRDLREEAGKLRAALQIDAAMPRNQEVLTALGRILAKLDKIE